MNYDRLIIGSGPEAVKAAFAAAENRQRVALIKPASASLDVSAQVLRQAAERIGNRGRVTMATLRQEVAVLIERQQATDHVELARLGIDVLTGNVQFVDGTTVAVGNDVVSAETIVLACGTQPITTNQTMLDGKTILSPMDLLSLEELPSSMVVVGAGRTGLDHAIVLATLGVEVTVVDEHSNQFALCGGLMDMALFEAQSLDIALRLGDEVIGIEQRSAQAVVRTVGGRSFAADAVLVCTGRKGQTAGLNLEVVGVGLDEHGKVWCDANGRTWAPNIIAVGDVVGFRSTNAMAS